jgi:hypothetical protein
LPVQESSAVLEREFGSPAAVFGTFGMSPGP